MILYIVIAFSCLGRRYQYRFLKDVIPRVAPLKRQNYFTFKTPATFLIGFYPNKNIMCPLGKLIQNNLDCKSKLVEPH